MSLFRILFITRPCVRFFRFPDSDSSSSRKFLLLNMTPNHVPEIGVSPSGRNTHSAVESLRNDNENACDQCDQLSTRSGKPSRV